MAGRIMCCAGCGSTGSVGCGMVLVQVKGMLNFIHGRHIE